MLRLSVRLSCLLPVAVWLACASEHPAGDQGVVAGGQDNAGSTVGSPNTGMPSVGDGANGLLPEASGPAWPSGVHAAADAALAGLMRNHWRTDFFVGDWRYAQILEAAVQNLVRTGGRRNAGLPDSLLWRAQNYGYGGGNVTYYDDMSWMALALAHLHGASLNLPALADRSADYLAAARSYFAKVQAAEDLTASGISAGIWWDSAHTQKNATVNASAALTGATLYRLTGDLAALTFAERVYAWWLQAGCAGADYTVNDHLNAAGTVTNWQFTHNYGVMVGAALALHRATGDASYLTQARGFANRALTSFSAAHAGGNVLQEACGGTCTGTSTAFKGIALRYLTELAQVDPNATALAGMLANSVAALAQNFNAQSGHAPIDWTQAAGPTGDLGADIAAALALATVGAQAPGAAVVEDRALSFEAEEAELTASVGIAAAEGASGWGVLSGWTKSSQQVVLRPLLPYAGSYTVLATTVGGPASTAVRSVSAAPGNGTAQLSFAAATGVNTSSEKLELSAGRNAITLTATSAQDVDLPLDTLVFAPTRKATGQPCGSPTSIALGAPVADAAVCGPLAFAWAIQGGNAPAFDVVLDGNVVCQGNALSCAAAASVAPTAGRHAWYVVAYDGCGAVVTSPTATFRYAPAAPMAPAPTATVAGGALAVRWTSDATDATLRAAVDVNGASVCVDVPGLACTVPSFLGGATGTNEAKVTVQNACGARAATVRF